ncbi:DegT/DnrJ/EryC1/StrS family aminotransferase [Zhongshania sp.]|uniref:DegT/DnrJ/EryC1/StrS family aminotransferase n=1 Tax=Zhongshania sp. TaxID=1971902 RepID=UPI003562AA87
MNQSRSSSWPSFTVEEAEAVSKVLLSNNVNYWTGDEGREFEREFANFCGVEYAVALANGTVALDLALIGLGVGPGDEVIVSPRTFLASASSIVNCGAKPVFADVDLCSQNISAETIAPLISASSKAIICVHLAGWPCDMDPIMALAEQYGLMVIEDCAQAHGAMYRGRSVGSIGHVGCWSFCQDKIMTTGGEGGMVTTNDHDLWSRMWSYKDHGKSWSAVYEREHEPGFRWLHESFGTNWRMTEMQAVIGRIQLRRMPVWHENRKENALAILGAVNATDLFLKQEIPNDIKHGWYKCYAFIDQSSLGLSWTRDRFIAEVNMHGIPCFSGSCSEVYLERCFVDSGLAPDGRLPNAKQLGESSVMFLVHPSLTPEELGRTCKVIDKVARLARK